MLESREDLLRRERLHARGRQLERERELVETPADLGNCLVDLEVGPHRPRPRGEEGDAVIGSEG
jgi:hypothetical protein